MTFLTPLPQLGKGKHEQQLRLCRGLKKSVFVSEKNASKSFLPDVHIAVIKYACRSFTWVNAVNGALRSNRMFLLHAQNRGTDFTLGPVSYTHLNARDVPFWTTRCQQHRVMCSFRQSKANVRCHGSDLIGMKLVQQKLTGSVTFCSCVQI